VAEDIKPFHSTEWPWTARDDGIAINLAIGSMRESVKLWLTIDGRIHAETLLASIGALAGFVAVTSALHKVATRDIPTPQGIALPGPDAAYIAYLKQNGLLLVANVPPNETYYLGDLINGHLVPQGLNSYRVPESDADYALWRFIAGAAMGTGLKVTDLPDYHDMFRHVVSTIGTPEFGAPRVPKQHQPHLRPRQALDLFWPRAKFVLTRTDGPGPAKGHNAPIIYWPLVMNFVAGQLLAEAVKVVEPRMGIVLVMEAAIAMSKLNPRTVPQDLPKP
jgi:hypothetical protein